MSNTLEERIEKLELSLAYQEQTIQDMSSEIYKQHQLIERQSYQLEKFRKKIAELEESIQEGDKPHNEKPPHY